MPAGFNKGQIEYIKTIANVNGHKTYKPTCNGVQNHANTVGTGAKPDTYGKYAIWCLGRRPLMRPTGAISASTNLASDITINELDVYNVPINQDQKAANESQRVTPECFLESVSLKMRHIIDLDDSLDADSHKEFRLVVFRHREKQHVEKALAQNHSNPLYDSL